MIIYHYPGFLSILLSYILGFSSSFNLDVSASDNMRIQGCSRLRLKKIQDDLAQGKTAATNDWKF